ncbi:MAG TPA: UDP-N-acetylmuramoyl-L-alanyl-D-glutamate--2,6-diaminopimelate ligase [Jatrophihabitans sp.]|nr:UDP-N-acetylmuramoyl-L-alanyl-D-glutamate--2,6-diaminopimelate ligase [Jatrophihabitans sp.]
MSGRPSRVPPRPLAELAALIGAAPVAGSELASSAIVSGITGDSADVRPGDLFAALPSARGGSHGIAYLPAAVAAGAVAVLTDPAGAQQLAGRLPALVVDDPRAALGPASALVYGHPSAKLAVLGVTGTSGKTTTTFLIRAGLRAAEVPGGVIGTVGMFLGEQHLKLPFTTPEAPQLQALLAVMAERGLRAVAMEVSSHALRLGRVDGTEFEVGAFTNLSQDHLDFHADMADYFAAKALLFDGRARREVVMVDDEWGRRLVRDGTVTVSAAGATADWRAERIETRPDGSSRFLVRGPDGLSFAAGCRLPGAYNVANTVLACAVLAQLGVDLAAVAPALAEAQVPGRMERVDGDQPFLAVVDYSHKPAGVAGALQALRPLTAGRLILVLGCGGDRDQAKRPVMGRVGAELADVLVVTDDNPRSEDPATIRAAMLAGARAVPAGQAAEVVEEGDRRRAIELAISLAGAGDTVLVAGKGHETGQEVAGTMLAFDDVTVLRETLSASGFATAGADRTGGRRTSGPGAAAEPDVTAG